MADQLVVDDDIDVKGEYHTAVGAGARLALSACAATPAAELPRNSPPSTGLIVFDATIREVKN